MYFKLYAIMLMYQLFAPPIVPLAVGPGTTVVVGPRNKDGTINYVAALNERMSRGVTAKNNAFVVVAKLMPPGAWRAAGVGPVFRAKVFAKLGVKLPGKGALYFHPLPPEPPEHLPATWPVGHPPLLEVQDRFAYAARHLWTDKRFPKVARWLDSNTAALDRLVTGVKRSRYDAPMISPSHPPEIIDAQEPWLMFDRTLATALCARAERDVARGHLDMAWTQTLAAYRLGREVAADSDVISYLVGISLVARAEKVTLNIAASPRFTKQLAARMQRNRARLRPLPTAVQEINVGARYMGLDAVMMLLRDPKQVLGGGGSKRQQVGIFALTQADPNIVLRDVNREYNRLVHVAKAASFRTYQRADERLHKQVIDRGHHPFAGLNDPLVWIELALSSARQKQIFISHRLAGVVEGLTMPAVGGVVKTQWRQQQEVALRTLAIALAAYRVDHGRYPTKLAALVPTYLAKVPRDLFSGRPLKYRRRKDGGVLLYSVGPDDKDEGGNPIWDDVSVHLPPPDKGASD